MANKSLSFVPYVLSGTHGFVFEKFWNVEYYRVKQHRSGKMPGFELVPIIIQLSFNFGLFHANVKFNCDLLSHNNGCNLDP